MITSCCIQVFSKKIETCKVCAIMQCRIMQPYGDYWVDEKARIRENTKPYCKVWRLKSIFDVATELSSANMVPSSVLGRREEGSYELILFLYLHPQVSSINVVI